jgi:hypothetical protein
MKHHKKVRESLIKWVPFSLRCYVGLFLRKKMEALLFNTPSYGDQSKEDEMGMACNTHMTHEKCVQNFSWKT